MHPAQSWLRELLKLFIQYIGVAVCSVPATLVYFMVLKVGASSNYAMAVSLLAGFGCAYLVWKLLDKSVLPTDSLNLDKAEEVVLASALDRTATITSTAYNIGGPRLAAGFAATLVTFSGIPAACTMELSRPNSRLAVTNTITSVELDEAA